MKYKKYIIPLILILSISLNVYWFVFRDWVEKQKREAFNSGVIYVFQQALNNGQVSYKDQEGNQVILILSR